MMVGRRLRVLIVDDSAVMRGVLRSVVASDPAMEVAGTAADGRSALGAIESLAPDIVILDVEMPEMDGLSTLRTMRSRGNRTPVIMCSALTQHSASATLEALASGASDYVAKPLGQTNPAIATQLLAQELRTKIHALMKKTPGRIDAGQSRSIPFRLATRGSLSAGPAPSVVVIGVSTGGPAALDLLLPALPAHFPSPVLVVQHMPEVFTSLLAQRLERRCSLRVKEAAEGDPVCAGVVSIARGNWHLEIQSVAPFGRPALHLNQSALENHCRPSVDVLLRSAAAVFGRGVLTVILTGMGCDGLAGARRVRADGGTILVQDETTSTVWGMPGAVARAGLADRVLPIEAIAGEILRLGGLDSGEPHEGLVS